ncbi:hypothetical protein BpHYR1_011012 [Brachionus plicatilis]|uniref:Uncharacterized protein n=1 Tax=Brachionus plicatilis TaxID=10195 RepID=A0A3M7QV75_BRAPC|nr:hypothetical protein BpHYR1_011012 [Brachionus plicatilis]
MCHNTIASDIEKKFYNIYRVLTSQSKKFNLRKGVELIFWFLKKSMSPKGDNKKWQTYDRTLRDTGFDITASIRKIYLTKDYEDKQSTRFNPKLLYS